ncbi:MAG: hypothetical protein GXP29_14500 [Planctomycetes bacterium]|nr:hypothetical protein [Planctomycetota bacterium]
MIPQRIKNLDARHLSWALAALVSIVAVPESSAQTVANDRQIDSIAREGTQSVDPSGIPDDRDAEIPMDQRTDELPPGVIRMDDILVRVDRGAVGAWPGGIVPVVFSGISASEKATHLQAMDEWNYSGANVTFIHRTNEVNYVKLIPTSGSNSSFVGMIGGEQELNVNNPGIFIAAHEQCHALGFHHEQSRTDRDSFVQINCKNINPDKFLNFVIDPGVFTQTTSYDYDSIMHYSQCKFTVCDDLIGVCPCILGCEFGGGDGSCPGGTCEDNGRTIVTTDADAQSEIGQRSQLSTLDVQDMVNAYGSGGANKRYCEGTGILGPLPATMFAPSGSPLLVMVFFPDNTIWLRGGSYPAITTAGVYASPGVLRAHGGNAVLGGG